MQQMSDVERLEDIKETYDWAVKNSLANRIADSDIEWLIEQAKEVEDMRIEIIELNRCIEQHRENEKSLQSKLKKLEGYTE